MSFSYNIVTLPINNLGLLKVIAKNKQNKTGLDTNLVLWFWNNHLKKKHGMASALDLKNKQDQQVCRN